MEEAWKKGMEKGLRDFMWAMFWKGQQRANLPQLEESVQKLIGLTSQKNAGQRGNADCINWENIDMVYQEIAIEATALVLDSRFDALKDAWEESEDQEQAWEAARKKWRAEARAEAWERYWREHKPEGAK